MIYLEFVWRFKAPQRLVDGICKINKVSIQRIKGVKLCMQWHFLNDWTRKSKKITQINAGCQISKTFPAHAKFGYFFYFSSEEWHFFNPRYPYHDSTAHLYTTRFIWTSILFKNLLFLFVRKEYSLSGRYLFSYNFSSLLSTIYLLYFSLKAM